MITITNTDSIIDSRDIIERTQELKGELESYWDDPVSFVYALQDINNFPELEDEWKEFRSLCTLAEQCEDYIDDWEYGATLIHEEYFEKYMDETIEDCYSLPKDLPSWVKITYDYDAFKRDYIEVDFDGVTYYIR